MQLTCNHTLSMHKNTFNLTITQPGFQRDITQYPAGVSHRKIMMFKRIDWEIKQQRQLESDRGQGRRQLVWCYKSKK